MKEYCPCMSVESIFELLLLRILVGHFETFLSSYFCFFALVFSLIRVKVCNGVAARSATALKVLISGGVTNKQVLRAHIFNQVVAVQ